MVEQTKPYVFRGLCREDWHKLFEYRNQFICHRCDGLGIDPELSNWCSECGGSGGSKESPSFMACRLHGYRLVRVGVHYVPMEDGMGFPSVMPHTLFACPKCMIVSWMSDESPKWEGLDGVIEERSRRWVTT